MGIIDGGDTSLDKNEVVFGPTDCGFWRVGSTEFLSMHLIFFLVKICQGLLRFPNMCLGKCSMKT